MVRLHNRRKQGGLGFPAVGGAAFDVDAGKSAEVNSAHWQALSMVPGVREFIRCGDLEVDEPKVVVTPPSPRVEAPKSEPPRSRRERSEKNK
jgi:hypothetical protein